MSVLVQTDPTPEGVLGKAALRAAKQLGLKQAELAAVFGVHRTAISRLNSNPTLDPNSKQGEIALLLVRVARSLFTLTGGDQQWITHFMHSPNKITGGIPAKQIQSIQGLITVLQFVDGLRGKV